MVPSPQVSWLFFKARAKRPYLNHTGRASNAEKQPTGRGPEGCVENGSAAALLVGYVSIQICALLAPCRRPILNATMAPVYERRCTSIGNKVSRRLASLRVRPKMRRIFRFPTCTTAWPTQIFAPGEVPDETSCLCHLCGLLFKSKLVSHSLKSSPTGRMWYLGRQTSLLSVRLAV
jgi:hypothetical protein